MKDGCDITATDITARSKDVAAGKRSEIDGLAFQSARMGERFGVPLPAYEKIAAELSKRR